MNDVQEETAIESGVIKFFLVDRGYGFIVPDSGGIDVMFHAKSLPRWFTPKSGVVVQYTRLARNKRPRVARFVFIDNE